MSDTADTPSFTHGTPLGIPSDTATAFGRLALDYLSAEFGAQEAERFAALMIRPTVPGGVDRKLQDRAWSALTARLGSAIKASQGIAPEPGA
jgi:hypothetical protein